MRFRVTQRALLGGYADQSPGIFQFRFMQRTWRAPEILRPLSLRSYKMMDLASRNQMDYAVRSLSFSRLT